MPDGAAVNHLPTVLQLLGLAGLALCALLITPLAGLAVASLAILYVGWELEKDDDASKPPN
jgi:hypothetical protein